MDSDPRRLALYACRTVAGIRLVNGMAALFAPRFMARRLGADPDTNGAVLYALRLFGIRTILIGLELLSTDPERCARSLRRGTIIHGTDTAAAIVGGLCRQLPARSAVIVTGISGLNTALTLLARRMLDQAGGMSTDSAA